MGTPWVEVLQERPDPSHSLRDRGDYRLAERSFGDVETLVDWLPKRARDLLPQLGRIRRKSGAYVDEELLLHPHEVRDLLAELRRLLRVFRREEHLASVDVAALATTIAREIEPRAGERSPGDALEAVCARLEEQVALLESGADGDRWLLVTT